MMILLTAVGQRSHCWIALSPSCYFVSVISLYHCHVTLPLSCSWILSCCLATHAVAWPLMLSISPVIMPYQSCFQPVSCCVTIVLLLANGCITLPLPCYIASGIPLLYRHAAYHGQAALPERTLSSLMLLYHTLSHCSTMSGYLAAHSTGYM